MQTNEALSIETIQENPDAYRNIIKLIERCFQYEKINHFDIDFYPLINQSNWNNCFVLKMNNQIIGHIGTLTKNFFYQNTFFPVAMIGGISIDHNYQGRGYLKHFLNAVLNNLNNRVAMILLWSNQNDLYQKFNFYEFGEQFEYIISPNIINNYQMTKLNTIPAQDITQLNQLYQKQYSSLFYLPREITQWRELSHVGSADLFIKRNSQNHIESYFFMNKGQDLCNIIYEACSLPSHHHLKESNGLKLWSPFKLKSPNKKHFYCMGRIGNKNYFSKMIETITNNLITINNVDQPNQNITFEYAQNTITLNMNDFLQGIWGPTRFKELQRILPNIFISGLESI
jgi:predicted N-acetyltransferase YhbS